MGGITVCLFIGVVISLSESVQQYYFVTGPNVIRFEHDETFTVNIFGNHRGVPVTVWFEHRDKQFSVQSVTVPDEANPVQTTVRVSENDIFDSVIDEKPRSITLCSRRASDVKICRSLVLSYRTGYLIVQTDKPIYTPLQKVKIRVLALDESLKAVSGDKWQVAMDIVSPSNLTLGRRIFNTRSTSGFYRNEFTLPPYPQIGMWTARAFYRGQFETLSRALFQIEEYALPTFGVTIDVSVPYILEFSQEKITITVKAEYVYGKPVDGSARLTVNITDGMGDTKYLMDMPKKYLEKGFKEFSLTTSDILNSAPLIGQEFPDGSKLLIVATVLESATGKEEATYHDETVFASEPYIFKFTRSKKYFRPGMEYYVQVDMLTANKQPAVFKEIDVIRLDASGTETERKPIETNSRGQGLAIFSAQQTQVMKFRVLTQNSAQESDVLEVHAYDDKNQIQVERVITSNNTMLMRATTNIQLDASGSAKSGYTGMLFMVVSRGKVMKTVFKPASNKVSEQISEALQELINPTARLIVLYVDEGTSKVVADSIKFDVDPKCRGQGLTLEPGRVQLFPGEGDRLGISGTPYSWVGLNAMDTALLLLNDKNILKKNKMFDALTAHDLGCGEGGGRNNGDVFKNAGLTILTNARIESDVNRMSEDCETTKRRKRSADDCYKANSTCCVYGKWYAEKVFKETEKDKKANIDPYTICYAAAVSNITDNVRTPCILAILRSCTEMLESKISSITKLMSRSFDDENDYASDLEILAQNNIRPHKRTDFRESFLFEEIQLTADGTAEKIYSYPDSITKWMIQGIAITENVGMCIADPVEVTVFRQFFIQLDLPYKATRLELFDVKATVFNYGMEGDDDKVANLYLEGVDGLCYSSQPGVPSPKQSFKIGPNSAKTVRFPMLPLKAGLFPITVSATVTNVGIPQIDVIEKKLYVVNEGIQEIITIQVCLDPNEQSEDCEDHITRVVTQFGAEARSGNREQISYVDLTLPPIAIPGTGSATAYIQGNIMDNVVQRILSGVESLFRCPHGCGEQTIGTTAPNVYAMKYLKQTNQMTSDAEETGNTNIRNGVDREKTMFQHADGSYSCCNNDKHTNQFRPTSVWLTAFVAKVFCQAKAVVDDVLDEEADLYKTIKYLNNHVSTNGQFTEIHEIWSGTWLKGSTAQGTSPSLTSFVLISLLECKLLATTISRTVDIATTYIENLDENWLKQRPFDLAIATYALSLTKSDKKGTFKSWLHSIERRNGKNLYWSKSDIPTGTTADAYSVETTAYALLAMLEFNDLLTSAHITRWLTSQQDTHGVFRSTQDTVVGLQALTEYNLKTYSPAVDLKVSILASGWRGRNELYVKNEKFKLQQIVDKLPVEQGNNSLTVKVAGTEGTGRMRIELRYNRPARSDEICPFELTDIEVGDVLLNNIDKNIAKERQCDVCGKCAGDPAKPDYSLITTPGTAAKPDDANDSDFGRKKRQADDNDDSGAKMKCIRFSVRAKAGRKHDMSMIYFYLETGVTVLEEDMKAVIRANENMDDYEMPINGNGFIVFYLNTLTSSHWNEFVFRIVDNFQGDIESRQPVSVDVFDYYNPDLYCRKIYGTGPNRDPTVEHTCNAKNTQCRCIQSTCVVNAENIIIERMNKGKKPALELAKRTCNPEKANFATIVRIDSLSEDKDKKITTATANVVRSIHEGSLAHENGDSMTFYWKTNCIYPKLAEKKTYFIIAKDGHKITGHEDMTDSKYVYPLMGTAIVVENLSGRLNARQRRIRTVMNNYKTLMAKKTGCKQ